MRTRNKVLALSASAVLLVGASVFGTMAYLTSTETVNNTFTVGNVSINLDEAKVDSMGVEEAGADRVKANSYKLLPGHTYVKDPTVTVKSGSESSYIRMLVTINEQNDLDAIFAPDGLPLNQFFNGYEANNWSLVNTTKDEAKDTRTYEFRYKDTVAAPNGDVELDALFDSITVPGSLTGEDLEKISELEIKVIAQAIQADGFTDADAAWGAWE